MSLAIRNSPTPHAGEAVDFFGSIQPFETFLSPR